LKFSIYDLGDPDLLNLVKDRTMSYLNLPEKLETLMSANIIIIVIDPTQLLKAKKGEKKDTGPVKHDDGWISNALDNISRKHKKLIYPVFVFTKIDAISKKVRRELKLPKTPPSTDNIEHRRIYSERILSRFYPKTFEIIKSKKLLNYDEGMYVFSNVKTFKDRKGKISPALTQTDDSGFVINCNYDEFVYFIEFVEKIAEEIERS
jgi:hypothetical protein